MKKLPTRPRRPLVGIAFTQGLARLETTRRGIVDYANKHGGWTFLFKPEIISPSVGWLRDAGVDGAFALMLSPRDRQLARSFAFPVINLGAHVAPRAMPSVITDNRGIGRMAVEYLMGLGFRQLGFYGANTWYACERRAGFVEAARRAGVECQSLLVSVSASSPEQQSQLERWLRGLRAPVGILASIDMRAAMIASTCERIGLRVPDEVAVMGVDNDLFVCEQGPAPLTSIVRDDWKKGWEAAAMLDRLMSGRRLEKNPVLIAPLRVEARQSTSTIPVADPFLAKLISEARAQLGKPFDVKWLVERGNCSRRWLEMRFRAELGHTPLEVINRLRVDKARNLLANPRLKLAEIAAQCSFADPGRLREVFTKLAGMTPKEYRAAAWARQSLR